MRAMGAGDGTPMYFGHLTIPSSAASASRQGVRTSVLGLAVVAYTPKPVGLVHPGVGHAKRLIGRVAERTAAVTCPQGGGLARLTRRLGDGASSRLTRKRPESPRSTRTPLRRGQRPAHA